MAEIATLRTKLQHVDIHNYWLRQEVSRGRIQINYTPTHSIMANGLTKALNFPLRQRFLQQIGVTEPPPTAGSEGVC